MSSSPASKRYSETLHWLEVAHPRAYRDVLGRVESWKSQANKWKRRATDLQFRCANLERQIAALTKDS